MSTSTPRRSSSGSTVAALPSSPTLSGVRSRLGRRARVRSRRRGRRSTRPGSAGPRGAAMRDGSTSMQRQTPSFMVTASGCAPPMPPSPPVTVSVPGERAAEALRRDRGEGLVGALQDALGADVDPRTGGHLSVHREPERLQATELRPGRPVGHQVGVGDQDARRPLVGLEHADRPAGLDEHGLVGLERRERAHQRVEAAPVARRLAGAAVDDQVVGALGHLGVEVVQSMRSAASWGQPTALIARPPRGSNRSGAFHDPPRLTATSRNATLCRAAHATPRDR